MMSLGNLLTKRKFGEVFLKALLMALVLTTFLIILQGMQLSSASPASFTCEIQTRNLVNQAVADVSVEVWNATSGVYINVLNKTDETGQVRFVLEAGDYIFKAFWKDMEVGAVYQPITENTTLLLPVRLSNLKVSVTDDTGAPIPLVDLNLQYNYTTRVGRIISETGSFTTNINGTVTLESTFTSISYLIEARRYGSLFNTTFIESLPIQDWNNITIIAPTYAMIVQVLGSQGTPATGLEVAAYEWSSGIEQPAKQPVPTDDNGNATLFLTFGRYRLRMYSDTTFVNEVSVDVVQNPTFLVVHSDIYNVSLSVLVVDYFGQPIPNVSVEFQRKVDSNYQTAKIETTEADGVARFKGIIGGDARVSLTVAGRPSETQYLYLVGSSKEVIFKLGGYVAVAGYALETSQFVTIMLVLILTVGFVLSSTYKRLPRLFQRERK